MARAIPAGSRLAIALLAVAAVLAGGLAGGATAGRFAPCVPNGAKVTLHHGHLVVFTGPGRTKLIRGCWGSRGRRVEVGLRRKCDPGIGCEDAPLVATAGRCTAAADVRNISGSRQYQLYVVDVKRRLYWNFRSSQPKPSADPRATIPGPDAVGIGPPTDVVMTSNCAVAWIASNGYGGEPQIRRDDSSGRVVLAKGRDIALHSLSLRGATVTWTQAGVKHHAHISGPPRGGLRA